MHFFSALGAAAGALVTTDATAETGTAQVRDGIAMSGTRVAIALSVATLASVRRPSWEFGISFGILGIDFTRFASNSRNAYCLAVCSFLIYACVVVIARSFPCAPGESYRLVVQ